MRIERGKRLLVKCCEGTNPYGRDGDTTLTQVFIYTLKSFIHNITDLLPDFLHDRDSFKFTLGPD